MGDLLGAFAANEAVVAVLQQSGLYLALHTADPTVGFGDEVAGSGYARQPIGFTIGSRAASNSNSQVFTSLPACRVNFLAVWTASSSGMLKLAKDISETPLIVVANGVVRVPKGELSLAF